MIKKGKWIAYDYQTFLGLADDIYKCSVCGSKGHRNKWDFCPSCGLPMTDKAIEILRKREGERG